GRLVFLDRVGRRTAGWGKGVLAAPAGVAVLPGGGVAVADAGRGEVVLLDGSGALAGVLTNPAGMPYAFAEPADVAVAPDGTWYVSDASEHMVRRFDATGAELAPLGMAGASGDAFDAFRAPRGLAVADDGRLFVADTGNHRVEVFDADGAYLTTIGGGAGPGTGGLDEPRGVAAGSDGRLLVADTFNHRVQVFVPAPPPWQPGAVNGLGRRHTDAVSALLAQGAWLYAGTDGAGGAEVWQRSAAGEWFETATGGFGDPEQVAITAFAYHGGGVYAGTEHRHVEVDAATGARTVTTAGGEIWRSLDEGSSWDRVVQAGFGVASNSAASSLASFQGHLYAGTRSFTPVTGDQKPAQLYRSASGSAGTWERIPIELFTVDGWDKNRAISALAAYSNTLLAGTCAQGGPQIWVSADGEKWRPAGDLEPGADPRTAGPLIGSPTTACVTTFREFDGHLYAGLGNEPREAGRFFGNGGAEVWRCTVCNGTDWEPVTAPGMGDSATRGRVALAAFEDPPFSFLYLGAGNDDGGVQVWRSTDGLDWEPQVVDGFGDDNNADVGGGEAMAVHGGLLHLGTRNLAHGGEVWSTAGGRPGTIPTPPGPGPTATPRPLPEPPVGRARYEKTDEWPLGAVAASDVIGAPVDLAVADDARAFILDSDPVRVLVLEPSGRWSTPFGGTGSGPDRLTRTEDNGTTAALAVDSAKGRVYVSDLGTERVLVYDRDGRYLQSWPEIVAVDLDVRPDGSVWVADILAGAVRRLDPDGTEIERIGSFGPDDDFGLLRLVQVAEDTGGHLWIADLNGGRLRVYDRTGGAWRVIRNLNLTTRARAGCRATRLQALGDDRVLAGVCVIDQSRTVARVPTRHSGSDLYGTYLRTANLDAGLYFAMATYDADRLDRTNETFPAVAQYYDDGFDIVTGQWHGQEFDAGTAADDAILNPVRLSTAPDGSLFVSDDLGLRKFSPEGRVLDVLGVQAYPSTSSNLFLDGRLVMGTGEPGRVFGLGTAFTGRRRMPSQLVLYGNTVQRRYCRARVCEDNLYVQTIWDTVLEAGFRRVPTIEFNYAVAHEPTKNQLVLLQLYRDNPAGVEFPARLFLFPADGMGRKEEVPLEGTDREALWTDVDAGPDGRIYVLDTLRDLVQVLDADGNDLGRVTTPKDAWRVAGGPKGEIFVLTTYGHVVRMA
ncbi:MAG: hypothetical protein ACE5EL_02730, partial [Anaerolineae bacterium]